MQTTNICNSTVAISITYKVNKDFLVLPKIIVVSDKNPHELRDSTVLDR